MDAPPVAPAPKAAAEAVSRSPRPQSASPQPGSPPPARAAAPAPAPTSPARPKLSFKEQRELAALPRVIEALEAEREALRTRTGGAEFYKEGADAIRDALARIDALDAELTVAYDRWNVLDARA
jgi:ATP-binding cassette subfamily F protein uup